MVIARAAEGGMRDALSILDMCLGYGDNITEEMVRNILGTCDQGFLFRFAQALAEENTGELFRMIDVGVVNVTKAFQLNKNVLDGLSFEATVSGVKKESSMA